MMPDIDTHSAGVELRAGDEILTVRGLRKTFPGVVALDAVETPEEIEMPPGAAEFTVGDRSQPDIFLLRDDARDLAVFGRLQRRGIDRAAGVAGTRIAQRCRAQQAADMVSPEGRPRALHGN